MQNIPPPGGIFIGIRHRRPLGQDFAVRVPAAVAESVGLRDGEVVEIEALDGDLLLRRTAAHATARQQAEAAVAEIEAESRHHRLDGVAIRDLLEEGRRG